MPEFSAPTASLAPLEFGKRFENNPDNLRKVRNSFENRSAHNEGMPVLLHVEPSAECNMTCPGCPRGIGSIKRSGFLEWEDFHRTFTALSPYLCNVIFSGWGEPLLNPRVFGMISTVASYMIPSAMNTNGILVGENAAELVSCGLDIINISLDGAVSKTTHSYADGRIFDRVVDGFVKLRKTRENLGASRPEIHGQFILDEETVDEIAGLKEWAFQIGADHIKFKRRHEIMPGQTIRSDQRPADELCRIDTNGFVESSENRSFSAHVCAHPWESVFLASTGKLGICSWDSHHKIDLGVMPEDFDKIWNGKTVQTIRYWHSQKSADAGEPCRTCNRLPGYLRVDDAAPPENTK